MAIGALYTAGIVATTAQRPRDVIDELCEAMAGKWAFVGNQLIVRAGEYVTPVISLGDDDFAGGPVTTSMRAPRESTSNVINATLLDASQNYKEVDMPRVAAAAYITADGQELPVALQYDAITNPTQAQQVSAVRLREDRQGLTTVARFNLAAFAVELFDTVALTNTVKGWAAKPFEVLNRKWTLDGLIELTQKETDPTIYAFGDTFDAVDAAPNTNLPQPHQVEQLSGLAVESGTAELSDGSIITRTRVTWTATADQSVLQNGKVEIQYLDALQIFPPADWPSQFEQGAARETVIVGLRGGRTYVFRGRFLGLGGRVRGKWSSPQVLHTVAQPPKLAGQNLFVNASFEIDTANIADNWTPISAGTHGTITHSDATGIFGTRAQRTDATNLGTTSADRVGYQQGVSIPGLVGKNMTLSVYAEGTSNAKLGLVIDWYTSASGSFLSESIVTGTLTSSTTQTPRFTLTGIVPISCGFAVCYIWIQERPSSAGAAYLRIDAAQFEQSSEATPFAASADEAAALAAAALASATAAAADATAALAQLNSISSDNVLSPGEKPGEILRYNILFNEQAGIDAQAVSFGITTEKSAYDNTLSALNAYLAGLTGWNVVPGTDVAIVGTIYRSNWAAAYAARQVLLNAIADAAANTYRGATGIGGGNLLFNAGLETAGSTGTWDTGAAGWYSYAAGGEGFTPSKVTGRTSGTAIRISWSGANTGFKGIVTNNSNLFGGVAPGVRGGWQPSRSYVISFWARANSSTAAFSHDWNTAPASSVPLLAPTPSSTEWRRWATRITWGGSVEALARLYVKASGTMSGWIEIDDLQVEEGDVLTAWTPGSIGAATIEPGGATETFFDSGFGSTSALFGGHHDTQLDTSDTICSVAYTNTVGRAVTVQFEAAVHQLFVYGTPLETNFTTAEARVIVSGAVSGNGTSVIYDLKDAPLPLHSNYIGTTRVFHVTVADGATLGVAVELHSVLPSTSTSFGINGDGTVRGAAIKA